MILPPLIITPFPLTAFVLILSTLWRRALNFLKPSSPVTFTPVWDISASRRTLILVPLIAPEFQIRPFCWASRVSPVVLQFYVGVHTFVNTLKLILKINEWKWPMNKYYIHSKYVSISKMQKPYRLYFTTLQIYTGVHTFAYTLKLI